MANNTLDTHTLALLHNNYLQGQQQTKQSATNKKQSGNFLTHLLPTIGGTGGGIAGGAAGGALAGSAILPGIGTAVGGLAGALLGGFAGGAGGKAVENKIEGKEIGNGVVGQGIEQGVLSAGPLKLLKGATLGAKAGIIAAKGGEGLAGAINAVGDKATTSVLRSKVASGAADRTAKGFGNEVGATVKGKTVTPGQADQLQQFINKGSQKYGGIKSSNPLQQARDAQSVHSNVISKIDETLNKINRPLTSEEIANIGTQAADKVAMNAGVTGATGTLTKLTSKLAQAKDLKGLESIRREADDLAYTANAAGKTAKAAQAKDFRDAVDEFITPLSKDYKAVKGDYSLSKQALEATSRASKSAKGVKLPLLGVSTPAQATTGILNRVNSTASKIPTGPLPQSIGVASRTLPIGTAQAGIESAGQQQPTDLSTALTQAQGGMQVPTDPTAEQPAAQTNPYSQENLLADIQRDPKNASKYIDYYQQLDSIFTPKDAGGGLNSTAAGVVADTTTGLQSLSDLYDAIGSSSANNPLIGKLRGLNPLDTNAQGLQQQIAATKQIVGKALEGGVLRAEDEKKYAKILPTLNDTDAVAQAKIKQIYNLISQRLQTYQSSMGSTGGSTDLTSALLAAGQ